MEQPGLYKNYQDMSLNEFVTSPGTVDFSILDTSSFREYVKDKPYIKIGAVLENKYLIAYTKVDFIANIFEELGFNYSAFYPQIMSLLSKEANDYSGITKIQKQPVLRLTGKGILLGFIDTGIDYSNDVFKYEDGTTRIKYIWDQTINEASNSEFGFGHVYSSEDINNALKSDDRFKVVPSNDTIGHGTFLASVAGARSNDDNVGAAPDAEFIVVKMQTVREYFKNQFELPSNQTLYETTDFMLGIKFIVDKAHELNMPVVICVAMGTNFGSHNGTLTIEEYISMLSNTPGIVFILAGGNESNKRRHTEGKLSTQTNTDLISVKVGENAESAIIYIVSAAWDKFSVGIKSPTGEVINRVPFKIGYRQTKRLLFESSVVIVEHYPGNDNYIIVRIRKPTQGIWEITLYGDSMIQGSYHAWLPIYDDGSPDIDFLKPSPNYTIVSPATAMRSIVCGAYNYNDNSLYISSSWGPSRVPRILPDLVAPGVNVSGIFPTGPGTMSGTSVAAAITAGASALLLEWGIVNKHEPGMDSDRIRALLISGCKRDEKMIYPNDQWGYGKLDLYGTFNFLREL